MSSLVRPVRPMLAVIVERLAGRTAVLDGEIVTHDPAGRPSFSVLQQRGHRFVQGRAGEAQWCELRLELAKGGMAEAGADMPRGEHARDAIWVQPVLVGDVAYRTMTPDRRLRHPSWRGLRADRTPDEVRIDAPS